MNVLEYEAPYRHCFFVKNTAFLEYIAHRNCVNIMIYFGVYSILNKMNLLGLIQWICLYLILKKNFRIGNDLFTDVTVHLGLNAHVSAQLFVLGSYNSDACKTLAKNAEMRSFLR